MKKSIIIGIVVGILVLAIAGYFYFSGEKEISCPNYDGKEQKCLLHEECKWILDENICEPIYMIEDDEEEGIEDDEGNEDDLRAPFISELEADLLNTPSNEICKQIPLVEGLSSEEILALTAGNRYTCLATVNNKPEFCELIDEEKEKYVCLAHSKKDVSYCKNIIKDEDKKHCYFYLSLISGDINVCDSIDYSQHEKEQCYWSFANALYWEDKSDKITTEYCNKLPAGSGNKDSCLAFKDRDVSLCKGNFNCLTFFEQPMSFCTTGEGKALKYCIRNRAMASKNISICETLTGELRDDCFGDFAGHISQDILTCDKIDDYFLRNTCYYSVAVQTNPNFFFELYN